MNALIAASEGGQVIIIPVGLIAWIAIKIIRSIVNRDRY